MPLERDLKTVYSTLLHQTAETNSNKTTKQKLIKNNRMSKEKR